MSQRKPQAKDIPDDVILQAIAGLQLIPRVYQNISYADGPDGVRVGPVCNFTPMRAVGWDLHKLWSTIPEKVINAKLKKMVDRGLLDGCPCGCRGDFTVTDKGRELMGAV